MKFEKTEVWGFAHAIRGMRNPLNSWHKSDSVFNDECHNHGGTCETCRYFAGWHLPCYPVIGANDMRLAKSLITSGSEHRKFLRQIFVSVDITAPLYWWKEFDTYKVGTVANSTSTMHKIHSKEFERSDFSCDRMSEKALKVLDATIEYLEEARQKFNDTKDKQYWDDMIQLLPASYNQTRTCTMNYENILSMVSQRMFHKLNEWSGRVNPENENFIAWARSLPYAQEFIFDYVELKASVEVN